MDTDTYDHSTNPEKSAVSSEPSSTEVIPSDTATNAENPVLNGNDLLQRPVATGAQVAATSVIKPAKIGVLKPWGKTPRPPPIEWVVHHMFQARAANSLAGEPGVGKSWLACDLVVSVATGTPFLGRETQQGGVLIINLDDGETLPRQYAERTAHARGYAFDELPIFYPPEEEMEVFDAGMLDPAVLSYLAYQIEALEPRLILVDSFASAFPGVGGNGSKQVVRVHRALRQLRLKSFNAALVILDHTPKKGKGPSGSVQKNARVCTGHIISRLEYFGKDMLLWEFDKFNAAPPQPSFAIEREQDEMSARLIVHDLPGQLSGYKAQRALETALKLIYDAGEDGITRATLTEQVMTLVHVSKRTFDGVVVDELREHPKVIEVQLEGRGKPLVYRWRDPPEGDDGDAGDEVRNDTPAQMEVAPVPIPEPFETGERYGVAFGLYCPRCLDLAQQRVPSGNWEIDKMSAAERVKIVRRMAKVPDVTRAVATVLWQVGTRDVEFPPPVNCKKHRVRLTIDGLVAATPIGMLKPPARELATVVAEYEHYYASYFEEKPARVRRAKQVTSDGLVQRSFLDL